MCYVLYNNLVTPLLGISQYKHKHIHTLRYIKNVESSIVLKSVFYLFFENFIQCGFDVIFPPNSFTILPTSPTSCSFSKSFREKNSFSFLCFCIRVSLHSLCRSRVHYVDQNGPKFI